jgi:hypothetical protein
MEQLIPLVQINLNKAISMQTNSAFSLMFGWKFSDFNNFTDKGDTRRPIKEQKGGILEGISTNSFNSSSSIERGAYVLQNKIGE